MADMTNVVDMSVVLEKEFHRLDCQCQTLYRALSNATNPLTQDFLARLVYRRRLKKIKLAERIARIKIALA